MCETVLRELERAARVCETLDDERDREEHWQAAVALNDAASLYYASLRRHYRRPDASQHPHGDHPSPALSTGM